MNNHTPTCKDCGKAKPSTEFYKDKSRSSGYHQYCKTCACVRSAERYRRRNNVAIPKTRRCTFCATEFQPSSSINVYCSAECRDRTRRVLDNPDHAPRPKDWGEKTRGLTGNQIPILCCAICNNLFESSQPMKRTCSDECATQYTTRTDTTRSDRRRARLRKVRHETIVRKTVYERDRWICGICGEAINPHAKYPDRMSASLDHITPISHGGSHTMDNVQAAHWICNVRRGVKPLGREVFAA